MNATLLVPASPIEPLADTIKPSEITAVTPGKISRACDASILMRFLEATVPDVLFIPYA